MSRKASLLERIYDRNPQNGNYIIEVSLENYVDIFNDWDHAPLRRKDIDPELLSFLDDSIDDIPTKEGIDICFYLSDQAQSKAREQQSLSWFRGFYTFYIEREKKKIRSIFKKASIGFLVSAIFLVSSYLGSRITGSDMPVYILSEIVIVGGWVFMWEAISLMTFERARINRLIKNYRRFARTLVAFR